MAFAVGAWGTVPATVYFSGIVMVLATLGAKIAIGLGQDEGYLSSAMVAEHRKHLSRMLLLVGLVCVLGFGLQMAVAEGEGLGSDASLNLLLAIFALIGSLGLSTVWTAILQVAAVPAITIFLVVVIGQPGTKAPPGLVKPPEPPVVIIPFRPENGGHTSPVPEPQWMENLCEG